MYSIILMTAVTGAPATPDFHRAGCSGVAAVSAPRTGCHGNAQIARSRTRTVTSTHTASVAVPAPEAVIPLPAVPKAPPAAVTPVPVPMTVQNVAAPPVFAPLRAVCGNGNCGFFAPARRMAFWR